MTAPVTRDPREIFNQPPPLAGYDPLGSDAALTEALEREGGGWGVATVREFALRAGSAAVLELGELANRHPPILHIRDRFGRRRAEVEFHPAWHELMRMGVEAVRHSPPWAEPPPRA